MLKLDGKTLKYDRAFTHNGISYPANWLRLTTLTEKQAIGIVEVADTPRETWDQRFWWGPSNPKDLDQLKTLWNKNKAALQVHYLPRLIGVLLKHVRRVAVSLSTGLTIDVMYVLHVTHVKLRSTLALMLQSCKVLLAHLLPLGLKNHDHPYPSNSFLIS